MAKKSQEATEGGEEAAVTEDTAAPDPAKRTYLLEKKSGKKAKLIIPSNWKVTFGPITPYEKKSTGRYDDCWALRLYEGTQLRGIFTDVRNFRDMGIEILEQRISSKRQVMEKASGKGGKTVVAEATIERWVNPGEPDEETVPQEFLTLAHKPEDDTETIEF